ncbi:hypothetical protein V5T82_01390 [Magnetovibrio sp. PR-2]|uniref:hypothetical protein n=1 Tax=Magnetovibrio sp. PR-2 TaxID=3120356 RepID=UPI002FCDFE93
MKVSVEDVFFSMMDAGASSFGDNWPEVATYAETEFKKMAQQISDIANNVTANAKDPAQGYDAQAGKILMDMQRISTISVLVAMSAMTMIMVEQAVNAMLDAVKGAVGGVLTTIL